MKRDKFILYSIFITIVLTIVLGNVATFDIFSGHYKGMPMKVTELLMAVTLIILLIVKRNNIKFIKPLNMLILWIVYGICMIFANYSHFDYTMKQVAYGVLYAFRLGFYIIFVYYAVNFLNDKKYKFDKLIDIFIFSYCAVGIIGIFQLIFYPKAINFYELLRKFHVYLLNPDPHHNRLISTYLDPNFLGTIASIPLMLCLVKLITHDFSKNLKKGIAYVLSLVVTTFMLALTISRSGIGSLGVSLLVFILLSIKIKDKKIYIENFKRFFIAVAAMLLIVFVAYHFGRTSQAPTVVQRIATIQTDPSAQARVQSWTQTTKVIQKSNPIFGIGYNMYGFVKGSTDQMTSFGTDSSLMLILATTGIIGIIIYGIYILWTIKCLFSARKGGNLYIGNALIAVFIASIAASNFNNLLFYPLWLLPFLILSNYFIIQNKSNK